MALIKSIVFFLLAGLCEISGGYMLWKALKENQPIWIGILGGTILVLYGVVATSQTASFGCTYAAYGGVFIIMSLMAGWMVDKIKPDKYDIIGGAIVLVGAAIIFYAKT